MSSSAEQERKRDDCEEKAAHIAVALEGILIRTIRLRLCPTVSLLGTAVIGISLSFLSRATISTGIGVPECLTSTLATVPLENITPRASPKII